TFLRVLSLDAASTGRPVDAPKAGQTGELRAFRARVQGRIGERTWAEWQQIFAGESEITVEPFLMPGEALDHPQFVALRDSFESDGVRQLGPLVQQSETPARAGANAPALGSLGSAGFRAPRASAHASAEPPARGGLFEGITLLELATWIATPYAGVQL